MQRRLIETESLVRKWLTQRLDRFHCDLQVVYTPPLTTIAQDDEAVSVDAHGMKPTGPNPHPSVCGRPFCAIESDGNENEGGAI